MKTHTLDVYDVDLALITTAKQHHKVLKVYPHADLSWRASCPGSVDHLINDTTDRRAYVITVNVDHPDHCGDEGTSQLVNTCAHEAAHVAHDLLLERSPSHPVGTEPYSYLVGWLTQWLWEGVQA